ncbi:amidohydrolase family protein [Agreia bicolorata]|uniref:amidohydrolase family protein n=1 Tax=Agreia bicolorata TaxID=110935 RepID=UPI000A067359|nr:amidohydrolase family protein [Agreia bicolorata]
MPALDPGDCTRLHFARYARAIQGVEPTTRTLYPSARPREVPNEGTTTVSKVLLKGGTVLPMSKTDPVSTRSDVLIDDGIVVAIAPAIDADAETVDCSGRLVLPGFVDTHRHTWETLLRNCAPDATLDEYFARVLDHYAPYFTADDVYAGNLLGALECLNAGITTLVDWSHINNSPDHPEAAIQALRDSGIRAQYAYGPANDVLPGALAPEPTAMPVAEIRRLHNAHFSSNDALLTMALAARGPGFTSDEIVRTEWAAARDLGIPITFHAGMSRVAGRMAMVEHLERLQLLGPDITYIHANHFADREWKLVADSGGTLSLSPQVEMQMNHGWPPVHKAREFGLRPSLSVDVVTSVPGDMFTQMRALFAAERARVNAICWEEDTPTPPDMLTAAEVLTMATSNGAHTVGLEDRIGTLAVGKRADIVVIDGRGVNIAPVNDPIGAVVLSADVSNVEHVLVNGSFKKRDFALVADVARAVALAEQAAAGVLSRADTSSR